VICLDVSLILLMYGCLGRRPQSESFYFNFTFLTHILRTSGNLCWSNTRRFDSVSICRISHCKCFSRWRNLQLYALEMSTPHWSSNLFCVYSSHIKIHDFKKSKVELPLKLSNGKGDPFLSKRGREIQHHPRLLEDAKNHRVPNVGVPNVEGSICIEARCWCSPDSD
jgi:hypothetical protein